VVEEKKETDGEAIEKLQAELDKCWEVIEEEREKNQPVDQKKRKDFSALKNSINQTRTDIMRSKDELERFDKDLQEIIGKFKGFLDEQKAAKRYLEGENSALNTLSFLFRILIFNNFLRNHCFTRYSFCEHCRWRSQ
jgi:septal ring factor EnvC (AmiA/AmiB activator)